MFFLTVPESAAFRWLASVGGDSTLLLSASEAPWERRMLWLVRADRGELVRVIRTYQRLWRRGQVIGICWHAGAPETERLGVGADFGSQMPDGRWKFIVYGPVTLGRWREALTPKRFDQQGVARRVWQWAVGRWRR